MPVLTLPTIGHHICEPQFAAAAVCQWVTPDWTLWAVVSSESDCSVCCLERWRTCEETLTLSCRSTDHQTEDRQQPVCQRLPGLVAAHRHGEVQGILGTHCPCYGFISLILVVSYVSFSFFLTLILFLGLIFPFLSRTDFCTTNNLT